MACGVCIIPSHTPSCGGGDWRAPSVGPRVFWDLGQLAPTASSGQAAVKLHVELGAGFPRSETEQPPLPVVGAGAFLSPQASLRGGPGQHGLRFAFPSAWLDRFCRHQVKKVFPEP